MESLDFKQYAQGSPSLTFGLDWYVHDFLLFRIYGGKHEKRYSDECNYVRAERREKI